MGKTFSNAFFLTVLLAILSSLSGASFAQEKQTVLQLRAMFAPSLWILTIQGDSQTRTLRVTEATQQPDETLILEATFGQTSGNQIAISALMSASNQKNQLSFVTRSGTEIVAIQKSDRVFEGTLLNKKGITKAVTLQRVSEDEWQSKMTSEKALRPVTFVPKPDTATPDSCSSFVGGWVGTWMDGGIGRGWLWVTEVTADCIAKFAYASSPTPPTRLSRAEIKDGTFSFVCNKSTGGTCTFTRSKDELFASYSNPSGGRNQAVFKKAP